jgi:hypothetical protein
MQAWLRELDSLKTRFGTDAAPRKREILASLRDREINTARDLLRFHEALCFMRAFPDDRTVLALAEDALKDFASRVHRFRDELVDTGIVGTAYHYPYGLPMVRWLIERYGDSVDVDWNEYDEQLEDTLTPVLSSLASWTETAALDDEQLGIEEWFASTGSRSANVKAGALRRLLRRFGASHLPAEIQETLFNGMNLPIQWELGNSDASRTFARAEEARPFFHAEPLRGRTADFRAEIRCKMERIPPLPIEQGRMWIDLNRRALSVRERELYPLALANPSEVYEAEIGRGVRLIVIGMIPDRRLPIETDYAAFIVKNGMPIGYGIGAILFNRFEIAVNIFPTFRQGESSFLFEQFARFFHHQFGCDAFLVERYQLGHDNDEGLDAGSFWFYYKLGFRPIDPDIARLADQEAKRLKRAPGARSSRSTLKQLARSNVILFLDERRMAWEDVPLTGIGVEVSRRIETRFAGNIRIAEQTCADETARILGTGSRDAWPEAEQRAFERLSPLIRILPGIEGWPPAEKESLLAILRAKGGVCEAEYARLAMKHELFRRGLCRLTGG